jgi:hypothetical protein
MVLMWACRLEYCSEQQQQQQQQQEEGPGQPWGLHMLPAELQQEVLQHMLMQQQQQQQQEQEQQV